MEAESDSYSTVCDRVECKAEDQVSKHTVLDDVSNTIPQRLYQEETLIRQFFSKHVLAYQRTCFFLAFFAADAESVSGMKTTASTNETALNSVPTIEGSA